MYNPLAAWIEKFSFDNGIDDQIVKIAICLLSTFPLNAIMKRLPDNRPNLKCFYILLMSLLYLIGVLNTINGFRSLFTSCLFTYLITRFYSHSKLMPWINFFFVMGHLEYSHAFLSQSHSGSVITGAEMVMVMKTTAFAWSYYDGQMMKKLSTKKTDAKQQDQEQTYVLTDYQKSKIIAKHPSLLKYLAYCFFYPSLLTGPSFDFADFDSWLHLEIFKDLPDSYKPKNRFYSPKHSANKASTDSEKPQRKSMRNSPKREIPKNGTVALKKILMALGWLFLFFKSFSIVPVDYSLSENFITDHGFLYRIFYLWATGLSARFKYYAAWTIAEASCIVCGLGYNGFDVKSKKIKWNRVQNIDIIGMETAQNSHVALESWNQNTNKWLKYYVYLRVSPPGGVKKPGFRATFLTFLTSALWHGTSPGYYLTFITGACFQTVGKFSRRNFRPFFMGKDGKSPSALKPVYDIATYLITQLAFGYMVQPFMVLDLKSGLQLWASVYYYIHIGVFLIMFAFMGPYKKTIVKFLKSKNPQSIEEAKQTKEIVEDTGVLSDILKDKLDYENKLKQEKNAAKKTKVSVEESIDELTLNLGIPELDKYDINDLSKDYQEFKKDYGAWKKDKGLEIEEANIQKAFLKFKTEFLPTGSTKTRRRMSFSEFTPLGEKNE